MPWFSFHGGHSGEFCRHAKGLLSEVVAAAVDRGFTHYGLSEHCPRDAAEWLYPEEADLAPEDLAAIFERYAAEAHRLREAYEGRIELLVGFETERLPEPGWADRMRGLRADYGFEFMIGSVHHVGSYYVDFSPEHTALAAEQQGGREALQLRYFQHVAELVSTLRPEVVGHLDLVRKFDGAGASFSVAVMREIERTLEVIAATGSVLDVNPGAHRRGLSPVYPLPQILRRARAMGIGVTLGDDSHGPHTVGQGLDVCMRAIAAAGYERVSFLARRDGRVVIESAPLDQVVPRPAGLV